MYRNIRWWSRETVGFLRKERTRTGPHEVDIEDVELINRLSSETHIEDIKCPRTRAAVLRWIDSIEVNRRSNERGE